jgi:hypothetical protein
MRPGIRGGPQPSAGTRFGADTLVLGTRGATAVAKLLYAIPYVVAGSHDGRTANRPAALTRGAEWLYLASNVKRNLTEPLK